MSDMSKRRGYSNSIQSTIHGNGNTNNQKSTSVDSSSDGGKFIVILMVCALVFLLLYRNRRLREILKYLGKMSRKSRRSNILTIDNLEHGYRDSIDGDASTVLPLTSTGSSVTRALCREDYTVAWICALSLEATVAQAMLDEEHPRLPNVDGDDTSYHYGSMFNQNIVIASLPEGRTGLSPATVVAEHMERSFRSLRVRLMVGIGGGVPGNGVRLGDVVISTPVANYGGVVQYDFGKYTNGGIFEQTGSLPHPPRELLNYLGEMRRDHQRYNVKFEKYIEEMIRKPNNRELSNAYASSKGLVDICFDTKDFHRSSIRRDCGECIATYPADRVEVREPRSPPEVHLGLIASANQVMKDGIIRDGINKQMQGKILCFEMEAAGLMLASYPYLIIRGISDYADSHKNNDWQKIAASNAAACAKDFLRFVPPQLTPAKPSFIETEPSLNKPSRRTTR